MKILLLSKYDDKGASSRVRFYYYLPYIKSKGHKIDVKPLFSNSYIKSIYEGKKILKISEVIKGYAKRLIILLSLKKYDLIWIEKEIFPYMPAFIERILKKLNLPYIVDYDDAIFHNYDKSQNFILKNFLHNKIDIVMKNAAWVTAGNRYLYERAYLAGAKNITIIPTVVDIAKYKKSAQKDSGPITVGWIGAPSTAFYLKKLKKVFEKLTLDKKIKFVAIGAKKSNLKNLFVQPIPWNEKTESEDIKKFDIGIMPLEDSYWEKGKCGYKLIQYMACGIPCVASPAGVNSEIIEHGINGFLAHNENEWTYYLTLLADDKNLREKMGKSGRKKVETYYSYQIQHHILIQIIEKYKKNTS
jgi:glycosyltransferase involved in cell wall biosynthesis